MNNIQTLHQLPIFNVVNFMAFILAIFVLHRIIRMHSHIEVRKIRESKDFQPAEAKEKNQVKKKGMIKCNMKGSKPIADVKLGNVINKLDTERTHDTKCEELEDLESSRKDSPKSESKLDETNKFKTPVKKAPSSKEFGSITTPLGRRSARIATRNQTTTA